MKLLSANWCHSILMLLLPIFALGWASDAAPWHYSCFDAELDCPDQVKNGSCLGMVSEDNEQIGFSFDLGLWTLTKCRESCIRFYEENEARIDAGLKHFYKLMSAGNETFTDLFGQQHQVCDLRQGFTHHARAVLIGQNAIARSMLDITEEEDKAGLNPERHTTVGFEKRRVPQKLWEMIQELHQNITEDQWENEKCSDGEHDCYAYSDDGYECTRVNKTTMLRFPHHTHGPHLDEELVRVLQPIAEDWAGLPLHISTVYGIRRYLEGGWMAAHVDRLETHIISAIINIAQELDEPFSLDIFDHDKRPHKILMEPGDIVWYESARLPHGRVQKMRGRYFDNLFIHFHPQWFRNVSFKDIMNAKRKEVEEMVRKAEKN